MANKSVFGIYRTREDAEGGVSALCGAGFRPADISALYAEKPGSKDLAHEKSTKLPEGATAGVVSGALLAGALGWLVGAGALAIPGIGPLMAAGPIVAALAGAGAGAVTGGLAGAMLSLGVPEYEAKRFEGRIREGEILLSVHCDNDYWIRSAKNILEYTGATDVASASVAAADFHIHKKPAGHSSQPADIVNPGHADMPRTQAQSPESTSSDERNGGPEK